MWVAKILCVKIIDECVEFYYTLGNAVEYIFGRPLLPDNMNNSF